MSNRLTAAEYASQHKLEALLKEAANECYSAGAENPALFLATYFRRSNAVDVIESLHATEVLDGCGSAALRIEVTLANGVSAAATTSHSNQFVSTNPSTARIASYASDKGMPDAGRYGDNGLQGAEALVNQKLAPALQGAQATQQNKVDSILRSIDGTENFATIGSQVSATISSVIASAAATSERQPLFVRIAKDHFAARGVLPKVLHIPTPIITLFSCDPKNMGKVRVQSVCIIPNMAANVAIPAVEGDLDSNSTPAGQSEPNGGWSLEDSLANSTKVIEAALAKVSDGDAPPSIYNDGAIRFSNYESLQQIVDLVGDCVKEAGFKLGSDFNIGLVLDSGYCYKTETQKYSLVEGQEFSGGQVAEFLATFIKEKQGVVTYLEDTHITSDVSECRRLMSRLGETVTIAGNNLYSNNPQFLKQGADEKMTNNAVIRLNDSGTVSNALSNAELFTTTYPNATLTVGSEVSESNAEVVADLAVGVAARYIRIGGLLRPDHAAIANRLLVIKKEAEARGLFGLAPAFFPVEVPPPPAEPVVEVSLEKGKKGKK